MDEDEEARKRRQKRPADWTLQDHRNDLDGIRKESRAWEKRKHAYESKGWHAEAARVGDFIKDAKEQAAKHIKEIKERLTDSRRFQKLKDEERAQYESRREIVAKHEYYEAKTTYAIGSLIDATAINPNTRQEAKPPARADAVEAAYMVEKPVAEQPKTVKVRIDEAVPRPKLEPFNPRRAPGVTVSPRPTARPARERTDAMAAREANPKEMTDNAVTRAARVRITERTEYSPKMEGPQQARHRGRGR